jgi:Raf kinase inhibitor-like YbhB/YbcL family protein
MEARVVAALRERRLQRYNRGMTVSTKERRKLLFMTILVISLVGCSQERKLASERGSLSSGMWSVLVTSEAFREGQPIPAQYTADGGNISPQLTWSGHAQAAEYVVIMQDADSSGDGPTLQWLVYHIPRDITSLPANASATGGPFLQGKNSSGRVGYSGPDVSSGKPHRFYFQVFALDTPLNLPAGADLAVVEQAFQGTVLCRGLLIGTYVRQ